MRTVTRSNGKIYTPKYSIAIGCGIIFGMITLKIGMDYSLTLAKILSIGMLVMVAIVEFIID